jgi:hypothetical protein
MRAILTFLSILSTAACAGTDFSERPMTADEMPVTFQPQEVAGSEPKFERAYDDRYGTDVRRLVVTSPRGFAVMIHQSLVGDYVFTGVALQQRLRRMIKDDVEISWGDSGQTRQGATLTDWQAFQLEAGGLGCVGLQRELRHHAEVGNVPNTAQAIAVGYFCRPGSVMGEGDAVRLAAVLQSKS